MALASRHRAAHTAADDLGAGFTEARLLRSGPRFDVYEARTLDTAQIVAVKVPAAGAGTWQHDVLDHEADVLDAVGAHPHIVTLYRRVVLDDGRPALLMERCSAPLADELTGGGHMFVRDVVATGIKLAGALEAVHQAGWVHCDVRPRNVLVGEWNEPVLSGFTEAIRRDVDSSHANHVTTPHTAPELLEGRPPTPAADVYGLASTLYELVAGRAAFREYAGESAASVIVRVLSTKVKPIVAPGIPLEMSDLLTWAMRPDPSQRPPSPSWIAEELSRIERSEGWPRTPIVSG